MAEDQRLTITKLLRQNSSVTLSVIGQLLYIELLQLSRVGPSGLFRFRINYEAINSLDISLCPLGEERAHGRAST
jgi:hypothetical protein